MEFIQTNDLSTGEEIQLSYKSYGKGRPIVLIHGWPSSKEMWEYQIDNLVDNGLRVVKYDRRGFGKSSKPWGLYNYDAFAEDLDAIMTKLDLQNAVLIGFSMGGGEVARYLSRFGSSRVSKVVLISTVLPFMLKTQDNPEGVDSEVFEQMLDDINEDRIGFLDNFGKQFFGVNLISHPVSSSYLQYFTNLAAVASSNSTKQAAMAFANTDFRKDISSINVETLIIHGDEDQIVPIDASSARTSKLIPNSQYLVYEGAPHGLFYTHKDKLNQDLLDFILGPEALQTSNINKDNSIFVI